MKLMCRKFEIQASVDDLPTVRAEFIIPVSPCKTKRMADAFKAITLYMGETIELVKAKERLTRCFYCGQLNENNTPTCHYCGGRMPLPEERKDAE